MASKDVPTTRVQVYLTEGKIIAGLNREARVAKIPLSQAAGRAIARGLQRSPTADPDDRLLRLDRALRDHMRSTARDMHILQELVMEFARAFFLRLPEVPADQDLMLRAAADLQAERLIEAVAARIVSSERRAQEVAAHAPGGEERGGVAPEPRSFRQAAK